MTHGLCARSVRRLWALESRGGSRELGTSDNAGTILDGKAKRAVILCPVGRCHVSKDWVQGFSLQVCEPVSILHDENRLVSRTAQAPRRGNNSLGQDLLVCVSDEKAFMLHRTQAASLVCIDDAHEGTFQANQYDWSSRADVGAFKDIVNRFRTCSMVSIRNESLQNLIFNPGARFGVERTRIYCFDPKLRPRYIQHVILGGFGRHSSHDFVWLSALGTAVSEY